MTKLQRATYGPTAFQKYTGGGLPSQYPRTMGPNAMKYLQEVVESGLGTNAMLERFERAFATEYGVRHFIVEEPHLAGGKIQLNAIMAQAIQAEHSHDGMACGRCPRLEIIRQD